MKNATQAWQQRFAAMPLVAILRGLTPDNAAATADVLVDEGFGIIEVPLNSPDPFDSIAIISQHLPGVLVGAGTVLTPDDVDNTVTAGGRLIVAPNIAADVAGAASQHDVAYVPGVATPSEAFNALALGADALKLFPAELITPTVVKAMRAVLPANVKLLPVGGITPDNLGAYRSAGANGFGLGSALFNTGKSLDEIRQSAKAFVKAVETT